MNKVVVLFACLLMTGCNSVKFNFPSEISSVAYGCKNQAKTIIESKGKSCKEKQSCTVTEVLGEKNFSGRWCWYDATLKMYVGGTCNGFGQIRIGCNPNNKADIHTPSLTHEFAHYWLMSNYNDYSHNPLYNGLIDNWEHAADVTGRNTGDSFGMIYIDIRGVVTHVDAVNLERK